MNLDFNAYAIVLLLSPFIMAALAPLVARETGRAAGWILGIVPAGLFAGLASLLPGIAAGRPVRIAIDWVPALNLKLAMVVDGLSLVFALLITGIGAFILVYSGSYLEGHPQRGRFLGVMLAFMGAMLGLVLSDSFVALFAFWELTSVASFLLIGFDAERREARRGAIQALVVTGLGGLSLLAGGVVLSVVADAWDISTTLEIGAAFRVHPTYSLVLGLMLIAAFTKSAQVPFHFWLPNAMEAPTPVSAYLHSATMVQGGVYLLARLSPVLDGTSAWQGLLCGFGGATLLWGSVIALRQTDLKQVLAQTTLAALGLLVFLLGLGGASAAIAIAAYFVAHALYKAGLFLVVGIIDNATGTREIGKLGGLRDHLTISFIAAALAGLSMFGVPPLLGFIAKEEMYAGLGIGDGWAAAALVITVLGNALMGVAALAVVIRPFMGKPQLGSPAPKEAGVALWAGPALFGLAGLAVVFAIAPYAELILAPMASAIVGKTVDSHLTGLQDLFGLSLWLTLATWALAVLVYWRLDLARTLLANLERRFTWTWDRGFDQAMTALVRVAEVLTQTFHHGRLELYLIVVVGALAVTILVPMAIFGAWPAALPFPSLTPYEWGIAAMAVIGVVAVVASRTRLGAIVALGIQGLAVALIFIVFGAPDLGFTQLMIEVLSVVVLALVMTRLNLSAADARPYEDWLRDGTLAIVAAGSVTVLLLRVVQGEFNRRLSDFFEANAAAVAHGRNVVNVILVDFRGLDTLGEISVVMTAGIAILALLRRQHKRAVEAKPKTGSRRKATA